MPPLELRHSNRRTRRPRADRSWCSEVPCPGHPLSPLSAPLADTRRHANEHPKTRNQTALFPIRREAAASHGTRPVVRPAPGRRARDPMPCHATVGLHEPGSRLLFSGPAGPSRARCRRARPCGFKQIFPRHFDPTGRHAATRLLGGSLGRLHHCSDNRAQQTRASRSWPASHPSRRLTITNPGRRTRIRDGQSTNSSRHSR